MPQIWRDDNPSSGRWPPSPLTRGEGLLSLPLARVKVSSPSPRVERGEGGQRPGEGTCDRAERATDVSVKPVYPRGVRRRHLRTRVLLLTGAFAVALISIAF